MKKKKKVCELISQVTKKKHQLIIRKEKKTAFRKEPKFVIGLLDEKSKLDLVNRTINQKNRSPLVYKLFDFQVRHQSLLFPGMRHSKKVNHILGLEIVKVENFQKFGFI